MRSGVAGCWLMRAPKERIASLIAFITAAGAPAAVMNAINDALRPLGAAKLQRQPATPERILQALGKI